MGLQSGDLGASAAEDLAEELILFLCLSQGVYLDERDD
jgi:hypothetical protein